MTDRERDLHERCKELVQYFEDGTATSTRSIDVSLYRSLVLLVATASEDVYKSFGE